MKSFSVVAAILCTSSLAGCFGPSAQSLQSDPTAEPTLENSRTIFADRTRVTYNSFFGTQVEYHRPDGRSFLWFPGNSRPVPANWEVRPYGFGDHEICWQYPSASRNAVTGVSGGKWECYPSFTYNQDLTASLVGDPFGLASGKLPFRIQNKGEYTADQLMLEANGDPSSLQYVYRKK